MYGTIRKNYSARRPSNVSDNVVERSYKEKVKKEKRRLTSKQYPLRFGVGILIEGRINILTLLNASANFLRILPQFHNQYG